MDKSTGAGDPRAETEQAERKPAKYWHTQINAAQAREKPFRETGCKIIARYMDERENYEGADGAERRVNILWSNTQVLSSHLFENVGKPDVRRIFPQPGAKNKIARTTALLLERNIVSQHQQYCPDEEIEDAIEDSLLPGRGQLWLEYEPTIETATEIVTEKDENGEEIEVEKTQETLGYQCVKLVHVPWDEWGYGPAKKWRDVPFVWREHKFTREDLEKDWPQYNDAETGRTTIPMNYVLSEGKDKDGQAEGGDFKRAVVFEIWDKRSKSRIYVAKDFDWELERKHDPLKLKEFFPCPPPLFGGTKKTDSLTPRPEYLQYKDQAEELDRLNTRIWKLLESLKYRGFRFAGLDSEDTLGDIGQLEDGEFPPLKNFQALAQGGGLKAAYEVMDLQPIVIAIQGAAERAVQIVQQIYELTGISDVVRGSSDPDETATAQSLKARFGSSRLKRRQKRVQRFVAAAIKLQGEVIAENFEREQMSTAAGIPLPTEQERAQARQMLAMVEQMKQSQEMMAQQAQAAQQAPQGQPQPQGVPA